MRGRRWRGALPAPSRPSQPFLPQVTTMTNAATASKAQAPAPQAATTPTFNTVLAVLLAGAADSRAWAVRGWAEHIRGARAAEHAANSYAKHRGEFGGVEDVARALTVARCMDFGLTAEAAAELVDARVAARAAKGG